MCGVLVGMLAIIDLWGALMVPMLFGDAGAVAVRPETTVIEHEQHRHESCCLYCSWGYTPYLLVEVSAVGVLIENSIEGATIRVDRRIDGRIDEVALERALRAFKRSEYLVDRNDMKLAPSADGGVDFQDMITTIDVAARVGVTYVSWTTAFDLEAWSQLDDGRGTWLAPSRVVLEDCWRSAICPDS